MACEEMQLTCSKCGEVKNESEFYRHKGNPKRNYRDYWCKTCTKANAKSYTKENKERVYARNNEYRLANKEAIDIKNIEYRKNNKEAIKVRSATYYNKNKEKIVERIKEYNNTDYKHRPEVKTIRRMRARFSIWLHRTNGRKLASVMDLVGISSDDCRKYIEDQFTDGMTWDNIHIDHYVPLSYFDSTNEYECRIAWNYRNLRPLLAHDNMTKNDILPADYIEHIEMIKKHISLPNNSGNSLTSPTS